MRGMALQTPKPIQQGWGGGAPGAEAGIPLQSLVQTTVTPRGGDEDKNTNCILEYKEKKHEKGT